MLTPSACSIGRKKAGITALTITLIALATGPRASATAATIVRDSPPTYVITPGPTMDLGVCVDETGSLAGQALPHTKQLLHRVLRALVRPAAPGIRLYLREVAPDSYSPQAALVTAAIPPVYGVRPEMATPFIGKKARARRDAAYRAAQQQAASSLKAARAAERSVLHTIDALPSQQLAGSDITGCPAKLADIFASDSGPKRIVVVTDFEPAGFQTPRPLHFDRSTHVDLIDYCDAGLDAPTCASLVSRWAAAVKNAGASASVFTWDEMDFLSAADLGL